MQPACAKMFRMKLKSVFALICLVALAAFASGCGGDGADYPSASDLQAPTASTTEAEGEEKESSDGETKQPKVSGSADEKPEISEASGEPPAELIQKDIKKGDGKTAKEGDTVSVNYVGKNWSNNEEFDTSWGKQEFEFELGAGGVIAGWDEGVVGMKEGGRRLLLIPPDLGYGAQGSGSIPANETLIFVVDLVEVK